MTLFAKNRANIAIEKQVILVALFCLSVLLIAIFSSLTISIKYIIIPIILLLLFKYDSFDFILFPLAIYDGVIGMYIAGRYSLIWFYLALLLLKLFFLQKDFKTLKASMILIFLIIYFLFFSYLGYGMASVKIIFIMLCSYELSFKIKQNSERAILFVIVVFISSLPNVFMLVAGLSPEIEGVDRLIGLGFSDPNYSALVCLLGFSVVLFFDKLFQHKVSIGIVSLLFAFAIVRTGSRMGFIIMALMVVAKILLTKGIVNKLKIFLTIVIVAFLVAVFVLPLIMDAIDPLIERLNSTWSDLTSYSLSDATAGRTEIANYYYTYFKNQSLLKMLFGGNAVGTTDFFMNAGHGAVTHDVYLDYLLAFGLVFGIVFMAAHYRSAYGNMKIYKRTNETAYLALSVMKITLLICGFALALLQVNLWWVLVLI